MIGSLYFCPCTTSLGDNLASNNSLNVFNCFVYYMKTTNNKTNKKKGGGGEGGGGEKGLGGGGGGEGRRRIKKRKKNEEAYMKCTLASDETQLGWASATVAPCWWLWWLSSAVKGGVWTPPHLGQPLQPVLTNAHTHVDCCFPISVQAKRSSGAVSATERHVFMQFCVWLLPLFEFLEKRLGPLKTLKIALLKQWLSLSVPHEIPVCMGWQPVLPNTCFTALSSSNMLHDYCHH